MKKRKSPTNRFSFKLNKWVEDEAINWNGKDQRTGLTGQADGRWEKVMLSVRCL